jgi:hypothetical protein
MHGLVDLERAVVHGLDDDWSPPDAPWSPAEQVLRVYIEHDNAHRPHRALRLQLPDPAVPNLPSGARIRRPKSTGTLLGGLAHEYRRAGWTYS